MEEKQDSTPSHNERPARIHVLRQFLRVFGISLLLATLFTSWTPLGLIPTELANFLAQGLSFNKPQESEDNYTLLLTPSPRPKPRIGIVAGHWGNDSGAVCPDGLTEQQVNLEIASIVQKLLTAEGFDVDLLKEFDPRLEQYQAMALVSIHADSCDYIGPEATGFKVAAALASARPQRADRLVECLKSRYASATGLPWHPGSITQDMTSYHAFDEIHYETAAAIIETGFLNLDIQILTNQPEKVALGIVEGIMCYIYNESITAPTPAPTE